MALGLFDHWANLTSKKIKLDAEAKDDVGSYSPYMINRLGSMINIYLPLAAELTRHDIPKDVHYNVWFNSLPQRFIKFTYLKKSKDEDSADDLEKIQKYFESGTRDTALLLKMMSKEEKKAIVKKFGGKK